VRRRIGPPPCSAELPSSKILWWDKPGYSILYKPCGLSTTRPGLTNAHRVAHARVSSAARPTALQAPAPPAPQTAAQMRAVFQPRGKRRPPSFMGNNVRALPEQSKRVFSSVDHYVWWTILRWLRKKHRRHECGTSRQCTGGASREERCCVGGTGTPTLLPLQPSASGPFRLA
jgi:hypothetical protein